MSDDMALGVDVQLATLPAAPLRPSSRRYTIEKSPDRTKWLADRHRFFNASETATLFGEHPFKTLAEVAAEKRGGPRPIDNDAMRRGRHLEDGIAQWWAEDHGVTVYEPPVMYVYDELCATLDRRIHDRPREALEVKSTAMDVTTSPERYWWWQVQSQMLCGDLDLIHVTALGRYLRRRDYIVQRDDFACERIARAVRRFWEAMARGDEPQAETDGGIAAEAARRKRPIAPPNVSALTD